MRRMREYVKKNKKKTKGTFFHQSQHERRKVLK